VTGSEGTLLLSGETKLELGKAGGPLEDISAPDDLWEKTKPNNMWARSFVRLMREMVHVIRGGTPQGEPATFRDGWQVQRVLDAIRGARGVRLD
jgi:predicted dehydrogenase